jgi:hypothetical protein
VAAVKTPSEPMPMSLRSSNRSPRQRGPHRGRCPFKNLKSTGACGGGQKASHVGSASLVWLLCPVGFQPGGRVSLGMGRGLASMCRPFINGQGGSLAMCRTHGFACVMHLPQQGI